MRDRAAYRAALLAAAAVLLLAAGLAFPVAEWIESLLRWTAGLGPWSALALGLVWLPAAVLLVPGSLITLGTGFLLGPVWGVLVVSLGSTLGAALAFLVGRRFGREWVRRHIGRRETLAGVDRALAAEGLKIILLLRLSLIVPYNALNYALALTSVSLRDFVIGSWIGMLPGSVLYVWLGAGARSIAALATGREEGGAVWLVLAAGFLALAGAMFVGTRAARRALAERGRR
jgi:uncharacterized membrane protein YdjX (TVP38/TMEM64 family)